MGRFLFFPLLLSLLLVSCVTTTPACDPMGPRVECGFLGIDQPQCEQRGCCWAPASFEGAPAVDLPWCFSANAGGSAYRVTELRPEPGGGVRAALALSGGAVQPELGPDVERLRLDATPLAPGILRLRLTDPVEPRWEVPQWLFDSQLLPGSGGGGRSSGAGQRSTDGDDSSSGGGAAQAAPPLLELDVQQDPFSMVVTRGASEGEGSLLGRGAAVFNTTGLRLVYKDQYLELTTWLSPTATLYGAGERGSDTLHLKRNGMPRALWNHDLGPTFPEQNMYGGHPFVLALEQDGSAWGMLLLSSNAMDIVPLADRLSWRVTGGVLDMFLLAGPTPLDVLDQLTAVVGRPAMPPYWALGFHQCKYGYRSVWEVEEVVANYSAVGLPLEAIWSDIDHMDGWRDFTFDPVNYPLPEMQRFVGELHARQQRWVPIVDPGIKVDPGYGPYDEGLAEGVFMRGVDGEPYLGWVWPGAVFFPDFFAVSARRYFTRQLRQHHELVPWDGIWIDMDEVSNFCTGDVCKLRPQDPSAPRAPALCPSRADPPWVCPLDCREATGLNATQRGWLQPPYAISNSLQRLGLGVKAMSVLASHIDGSVEYNTHQLYGLSECLATAAAVREVVGKRPFVLSRASYLGLGAYAAHWTGDNAATWPQLAASIPGVLAIGLWGIPLAGADICGFQGDTTPELCARWISLGAFYPFSRDHSSHDSAYQELYRWPEVAAAAKKALGMRYRLLPYLYTAFHAAHITGAPVMRPLWANFPADPKTHTNDRQFMIGDSVLISPVLQQGADSVLAYFPANTTWHCLWGTGQVIEAGESGTTVELHAPLGDVPMHQLGGTVVAMQEAALTTAGVKRSPLTLVVALPQVLAPGSFAATVTTTTVTMQDQLYSDGGEDLEVGESPDHFVTVSATITGGGGGQAHAAAGEVLVQFGSPSQLRSAGASDVDCGSPGGGAAFEWPVLAGIDVLGWHLPAEVAAVDVVAGSAASGLTVVRRLLGPVGAGDAAAAALGAATASAAGLRLDLSGLAPHRLRCPHGLRVTWRAASPAADA